MKLKISRLFHWLYATLMFLPILMFIPSCLYYSLNKYATNETTTEVTYKYQSNEVNNINDIVLNNIYHYDEFYFSSNMIAHESYFRLYAVKCGSQLLNYTDTYIDEELIDGYENNENNCLRFNYSEELMIFYTNELGYVSIGYTEYELTLYDIDFYLYDLDSINNFKSYLSYYRQELTLPTYTDYNVIESVDTNVQDTISNKMYQAWEGVWNLPLFQWTKNSFITAPFSYITGLFGLSSDNSLNCVFTYFASISICWLVFDLIMYVPNLAHRWLDRSAIE